ncbi:hypothetical protein FJY71_03255 [candidate division WOR-3 bacterium]|nr:hypothetical protein [candidate division WOR-3 bacterium]
MRFAFVLAVSAAALSADTLDFGRYTVIVTSIAGGPLEAAAGDEISRRAAAVLDAAGYDHTWSVAAYLAAHPTAQRRLHRTSSSARQTGPRYLSDGTVTIDYEYPLTGPVLRLLMPPTDHGRLLGRRACPTCGQAWPEDREPPAGARLEPYEEESGVAYTGILIDCQGLELQPVLFPCVVTEQGDEVIGPGFSDPENIAAAGPVAWFNDRTLALTSERLGVNPLVVRAIGVTGANSCDPVVSRYDAARIHGSRQNLDLLRRCRVGLLTD